MHLRLALGWIVLALSGLILQGAEPQRVILQLKWKHQWQFAGYYAAREQGFYRKAGLDVEIREAPAYEAPVDVVFKGRADFGIASSDLLLRRAQGQPVVSLAAIFQHSPLAVMTLDRPGSGDLRHLKGQTLALEPHADEIIAFLARMGLDPKSYHVTPHSMEVDALLAGKVQAMSVYTTTEPFLLKQAGVGYQLFEPRNAGIDFYGDVLFTLEQTVKDHPEMVAAFRKASLEGWAWAFAHPEEAVRLTHKICEGRMSLDHLRFEAEETRRLAVPDLVDLGYQRPERWQHIGETYRQLGLLAEIPPLADFLYEGHPPPPSSPLPWGLCALLGMALVALAWRQHALSRSFRAASQHQQDRKEREERRQALLDTTHLGLVLHEHGRLLEANAAFASLCGRPLESLHGMEWSLLVAPEDLHRFLPHLLAGQDAPLTIHLQLPEGRLKAVEVRAITGPRGLRLAEVREP